MPPSDPACPTCGTQVRANDYWSYLAGPSSPRVYYPKSIMDDNPEIAGTFTRCADPFHAAPSDPAAVPPPEWAHDMAQEFENSGGVGPLSADASRRLAFLLASVCERKVEECRRVAAEFSDYCDAVSKDFGAKGEWAHAESWRLMGHGAFLLRTARLDSLIHTPPSGGAG